MAATDRDRSYTKVTVASNDGTAIGYRQLGTGPGLLLIHGGMKSSQDFMKLAAALRHAFTVYVMDRRGRGLSGPLGEGFSLDREVDDVQAIVARTGARNLFGLSAGALVALRSARATPVVERVALYEPPLSIGGSTPRGWVARFERELAGGKLAAALVTAMKGMQVQRAFDRLPRFLLVPMLALVMRAQGDGDPENVAIRALVPTLRSDMQVVREMADTLDDYRNLQARVLLLGGARSSAFFGVALEGLERTLPRVERVVFPGLGHDGPEDDGAPKRVAQQLERFFG
jgi:pimeloyl-ACP methyl ester carboxylesterase